MTRDIYTLKSEKGTEALGRRLIKKIPAGSVVLLQGGLGAGKTVLVRGMARGLGVVRDITSPTFVLMKVYPIKNHPEIRNLVHVDAYRVSSGDLDAIGMWEYVARNDSVLCIEWGEKVCNDIPSDVPIYRIKITHVDEQTRTITVTHHEPLKRKTTAAV